MKKMITLLALVAIPFCSICAVNNYELDEASVEMLFEQATELTGFEQSDNATNLSLSSPSLRLNTVHALSPKDASSDAYTAAAVILIAAVLGLGWLPIHRWILGTNA